MKWKIEYMRVKPFLLVLLFTIGILMRVTLFWELPGGLNQDEASIGYDTFADLTYGMDRNGYHNPIYSVAWGSGHSSLYITLSKPFIALFGLNTFSVRAVNVLFGCLALFAFYGLLKRLKNEKFALLGLFLLAINPWHIMMSRWGLECNLFPNVFIIATYFLAVAVKKPKFYPLSLFIYGLSLYAYGTSYMVVPVFLLMMAVYLLYYKKISIKMLSLSFAVFVITAVPIGIFMIINVFKLEPIQLSWISFPRLISGRYNTTVTVLEGNLFLNLLKNIFITARLLILQNDNLVWNAIPRFGTVYLFSMPFAVVGLIKCCFDTFRKKRFRMSFLWIAIIVSCCILGAMSELNINRANIFYFPILYLITEGSLLIAKKIKYTFYPLILLYVVSFALFAHFYFTDYNGYVGPQFFQGAGEAITYAAEQTEGTVYITNHINAPYIITMFYLKTDPKVFMDTVNYWNPEDECRYVLSFDRFVTGVPEKIKVDKKIAYVVENHDETLFPKHLFELKKFGYYTVATKR